MVSSISTICGKSPDVILGKPNPFFINRYITAAIITVVVVNSAIAFPISKNSILL